MVKIVGPIFFARDCRREISCLNAKSKSLYAGMVRIDSKMCRLTEPSYVKKKYIEYRYMYKCGGNHMALLQYGMCTVYTECTGKN